MYKIHVWPDPNDDGFVAIENETKESHLAAKEAVKRTLNFLYDNNQTKFKIESENNFGIWFERLTTIHIDQFGKKPEKNNKWRGRFDKGLSPADAAMLG